jgi:hypothetical protein
MTKYLIENIETKLWYYPIFAPRFVYTSNGSIVRSGHTCSEGWTSDPNNVSVQFNSMVEAKIWIAVFDLKDVVVTEHEFLSFENKDKRKQNNSGNESE